MSLPKLKILFFTETLGEGGITRVLLNLLRGIDRNRFALSIAVCSIDGVRMSELPGDIRVFPLNVQRQEKGRRFSPLLRNYRRILKKVSPEVVISSVWKPNIISLMAQLIDPFGKRKLILREDNVFFPYFREVHGTGMKGKVSPILTRLLYPHADHIIAVSEGLKEESVRFGIPEEKMTVIYNPMDLKEIHRQSLEGIEVHKPFILFVGRLCKQKNIPLLIHAYDQIRKRWDVSLLILGRGEEETHLRNLVRDLKMEERVVFKGYVSNPFPYMHRAQVFVLPSNTEGFSCVLPEAMACGAPVISTDCPHGSNELIRDGVNGFLVPMGDAARLAQAIEKILENDSLRKSLIAQGRKTVQSYDMDAIVRKYEELIIDIWSKHPAVSRSPF